MLKLQSNKDYQQWCIDHKVNIEKVFGTYAYQKEWLKPIDFQNAEITRLSLYLPNNKWGYFIAHNNSSIVLSTTAYTVDSKFRVSLNVDIIFKRHLLDCKTFGFSKAFVEKASDIPNLPNTKLLIAKGMVYLKRASYGFEGCKTKEEAAQFIQSLG